MDLLLLFVVIGGAFLYAACWLWVYLHRPREKDRYTLTTGCAQGFRVGDKLIVHKGTGETGVKSRIVAIEDGIITVESEL